MKNLKIHFLNTLWSDAIILESNKKYGFVDTGSQFYYPMIKNHLNERNITNLEFIILTHFHSDHYGNIVNLINDYSVKKLYLKRYYGLDGTTASGYASNEEYIEHEFGKYYQILDICKEKSVDVIFIDELGVESYELHFEAVTLELFDIKNMLYQLYSDPESEFYQQKPFNENFNSIGIFINVNNNHIFLGGDATCSATNIIPLQELSIKMINKYYQKYNINHIDIYKSCHHGGGGTNTLALCKLLNANFAIITNTDRWLDNWPTISNLQEANKDVVVCKTDYNKYIFEITDKISYETINEDSLFLTLKKN